MVNQVTRMLPLAALVEKVQQSVTSASGVRDVAKAVIDTGLQEFVAQVIKEYSGLEDTQITISAGMRPDASTSLAYHRGKTESPTRYKNGVALIRKYGNQAANRSSPLVRDLFKVARGLQTVTVSALPDPKQFTVLIRMSKSMFIPNDAGVYLFTPREVSAILCHEIGHTVWNVIGSDAILLADLSFQQALQFVQKYPSVSDVKSVLDVIYQNHAYPPSLKTAIEGARALSVSDKDKGYQNFLEVSTWLIMASSSYTKKNNIDAFLFKETDRTSAGNRKTAMERFCDTFAGNCGYGGDLAKALSIMSDLTYSPQAFATRYQTDSALGFLNAILNPAEEVAYGNYDPIYERMRDSLNASKRALAQDGLSADAKDALVQSIRSGEQAYAVYTSQTYVQLRHTFSRIITALASVRGWSLTGVASLLSQTFGSLKDALSVYDSGELAYMAALLDTTKTT